MEVASTTAQRPPRSRSLPGIGVAAVRCASLSERRTGPLRRLLPGVVGRRPVAFSAWLPFVGAGPPTRREHRTVCLPDYQGIGVGNALSALIASLWRGLGYRAVSTTTHPAMIRARMRSPLWRLRRAPGLAAGRERRLRGLKHATTRLTAGFEYVGPALPRSQARALLAD